VSDGNENPRDRLLERLNAMVATGRVTEDEAAELRAARTDEELEAVTVAIRSRHAGSRMEEAVAAGLMSRAEADANLASLRRGEHPEGLRGQLGSLRPPKD
jgi:hypothetical protein